jgi:hypothetical protein
MAPPSASAIDAYSAEEAAQLLSEVLQSNAAIREELPALLAKDEAAKLAGKEAGENSAAATEQYRDSAANVGGSVQLGGEASFEEKARFTPVRLSYQERRYLRILEGAFSVSEYTSKVDALQSQTTSAARRLNLQMKHMCAVLTGLVIASQTPSDDKGRGMVDAARLVEDRDFPAHEEHYQKIFELGRRYKILNPERMRDTYGKMIYFLQDAVRPDVKELLQCTLSSKVKSVYDLLSSKPGGLELLKDPKLVTATAEVPSEGRRRADVQKDLRAKEEARKALRRKYAEVTRNAGRFSSYSRSYGFGRLYSRDDSDDEPASSSQLTEDDVEQAIYSLSDHNTYLRFNREPVDKMILYLEDFFHQQGSDPQTSLAIADGEDGARLTHDHERQYTFVHQSLQLWREVLHAMFELWHLAEEDLLDPKATYSLESTGQGLQRVQNSPRVKTRMQQIVHAVQKKEKAWIGSSTVHLGDRNVPNALMFIDKYMQIPRILQPICLCLEKIDDLQRNDPALGGFIASYGGPDALKVLILRDFFRHAFDGSGADNFFEAGSCVDGRLTSAWNWCAQVSTKAYYPVFLLSGFTSFDGKEGW